MGYDAPTSTLEVEFRKGIVFHYFDVPKHLFFEFLASPSKGLFLNRKIRGARYRYHRVTD